MNSIREKNTYLSLCKEWEYQEWSQGTTFSLLGGWEHVEPSVRKKKSTKKNYRGDYINPRDWKNNDIEKGIEAGNDEDDNSNTDDK